MKKTSTIADIAKKSGYSISTVSRVLNHHPDVSKKAKAQIEQVVHSVGFVPNSYAQNLKKIDTNNILVIISGISNMLFAPMVEAIQGKLNENGYKGIVEFVEEGQDEIARGLQLIVECKPKGAIFLGGSNDHFQKNFANISIPSILLTNDASTLPYKNLSSVAIDDFKGAKSAINYLFSLGHKHIGIIGGDIFQSSASQLRYEGVKAAFLEKNIFFNPKTQYKVSRYSYEQAYTHTQELLQELPEITGIFAFSDVMAVGAIRAILDVGKKVPEDISVIGYDHVKLSDYYNPKLTTIEQNWEKIVHEGSHILINAIENKTPVKHELLPFTLIIGESTAPVLHK